MKRPIRFATPFVVALAGVPFLPLYIEWTVTPVMSAGGTGDAIEWGWGPHTLSTYVTEYGRYGAGDQPAPLLVVNLALALLYASLVALVIRRLWPL